MAGTDAPPSRANRADRISALPDGIREHVLSFLPAHEAVRTSVLARSWRNLWMGCPAFNITRWGTITKFSKFVFRLLRLRHGGPHTTGDRWAPLDFCHFNFTRDDSDDVEVSDALVNAWIQCVLRCQVRKLRFCFDNSSAWIHGYKLLHQRSLVSEHLTKLQIFGMDFEDNLDLSCCPALLDLEIDDFAPEEICSASLQHLSITLDDIHLIDHIRIRTPNLMSFKFTDCCGTTPMLGRMPYLATAVVKFNGCFTMHDNCLILNGLSHATNLELIASPDVFVFRRDIKCCATFRNLKTLMLADWFVTDDFNGLIWFLQHSPILEKLTLQLSEMQENSVTTEGRFKPCEQSVVSDHLKTIEIKCHEVDVMVVKILKILATSGIPLEQISIQSSTTKYDCVNFKCTGFNSK